MTQENNSSGSPATTNLLLMELTFLEFGLLLKHHIGQAGFSSLNSFATHVGSTVTTISECTLGKRSPPLDQLERWADELKLSPDLRAQFIQAGWRAKAIHQKQAQPWIQYIESLLNRSTSMVRTADRRIQWWVRRSGQLEQALKDAGIKIPAPPTPEPEDDERTSESDPTP